MVSIANYVKLLKESWAELQKWVEYGKFDPETEADIQCFLYYRFVEKLGTAKGIHAESSYKEGYMRAHKCVESEMINMESKEWVFVCRLTAF